MERDKTHQPLVRSAELVFFRPDTPRAHRRRRQVFSIFYVLAGSAVLWPVYPSFAAAEPRILGLPLALVWVVGALLAVFAALLWLYLGDEDSRSAEPETKIDTRAEAS